MTDLFGFEEADVERIGRVVRAFEGGHGVALKTFGASQPVADTRWVQVRNDANETIPAYGLLRVTGMAEDDGFYFFTVGKPNTTFGRLYLVNGGEEIPANLYGHATWLWVADYILYDSSSGTPAAGEMWGAKAGQWSVVKHRPGFVVLGGNTGTGSEARTLAMQVVPHVAIGKADSAIALDASGTVSVYDSATQGSEADTGQDIASCYNKSVAIASGDWVSVSWPNGKPYVVKWRC